MRSQEPWPDQPVLAQSFGWAVEHDAFHARVATIPAVFEAAAMDMGQSKVTADVVRAVWDKLLPGLLRVRCPLGAMLCAEGRLWLSVWVISLPLKAQHPLSVPITHIPRGMCDSLRHCSCDLPLVPVIGISTGMLGYERFHSQDQGPPMVPPKHRRNKHTHQGWILEHRLQYQASHMVPPED